MSAVVTVSKLPCSAAIVGAGSAQDEVVYVERAGWPISRQHAAFIHVQRLEGELPLHIQSAPAGAAAQHGREGRVRACQGRAGSEGQPPVAADLQLGKCRRARQTAVKNMVPSKVTWSPCTSIAPAVPPPLTL